MKKRDIFILVALVVLVIAFTAWENISRHDREAEQDRTRQTERAEIEKRLNGYGLFLDSLSITMLRIVDSLKTQAAVFESLAKQAPLEAEVTEEPPETVVVRAEPVAPPDTLPGIILAEYELALAGLPADLTKYEQKIAKKEIENAILAKYRLSQEEFVELRTSGTANSTMSGGG